MKSHMIEKTFSEHKIMVILYFWAKNVIFLNKNNLISKNKRSFQKQQ